MPIKNNSNGLVLTNSTKILNSHLSHFKGLMFSKKIIDIGYIFIFKAETKVALHMFFVFFPIDILWLDSSKRVVSLKEDAKPFAPCLLPTAKAKYVLELPAGTIKRTKTTLNDHINW